MMSRNLDIELIRKITKEDYERRLENVIKELTDLDKRETTGLFKRLMNYDRQQLFSCMGRVLNVSQTSVLQNRNELSFFESLTHFFHYYMYDDGELVIRYQRYNRDSGVFEDCRKSEENASPYVDYMSQDDEDKNNPSVYENDIMKMLDKIDKKVSKRKIAMKQWKKDNPEIEIEGKEFINYYSARQ